MQRVATPAIECPYCGYRVGLADFSCRLDTERGRVAICRSCATVVTVAHGAPPGSPLNAQRALPEDRARARILPPTAQTAKAARAFTRETLWQWQLKATHEHTAIVVDELVTTAFVEAVGSLVLALGLCGNLVRVVVADEMVALPIDRPRGCSPATAPRLTLVAALSADWGCHELEAGGKAVWADIAVDGRDYSVIALG